jgi:hypothetical protein
MMAAWPAAVKKSDYRFAGRFLLPVSAYYYSAIKRVRQPLTPPLRR